MDFIGFSKKMIKSKNLIEKKKSAEQKIKFIYKENFQVIFKQFSNFL